MKHPGTKEENQHYNQRNSLVIFEFGVVQFTIILDFSPVLPHGSNTM